MDKKTLIIGVGNLILKDEGVGIHAIRKLQAFKLPPGVDLIDAGTNTIDILSLIKEAERIIFIDALKGGGSPGTIYKITPADLMHEAKTPLSMHEVNLLDVLGMAEKLGVNAHIVIIGVEPKEILWGIELTPEVEEMLPKVIDAVFEELGVEKVGV